LVHGRYAVRAAAAARPSYAAAVPTRVSLQRYGPRERNTLDVYTPAAAAAEPRPLVLFVHGGVWVTVRGDARWVALRAHWVTLRARWVTAESSRGDAKSSLGDG
jgi:acetyl esterase/lipase